jgi:hypothetical protein
MKVACKFILFILLANISIGQNTFQRVYPSTDPIVAFNFINTLDGNYLIYGWSYNSGNEIISLFKIDSNGDSIWSKSYLYPGILPHQLIQLHDSSFAFLSKLNDNTVIFKCDKNGDSLWSEEFTYPAISGPELNPIAMLETNDHGFFVVTSHEDSDFVDYDLRFLRLDSAGNQLWARDTILGYEQVGQGDIIKSSDNVYFIQVRLSAGGPSSPFSDLIKVDSSGTILTNDFFWETGHLGGNFFAKGNDNTLIVIGNRRNSWDDPPYGGLRKVDSSGTIIWDTSYSQFGNFGSIARTSDNGCIVACDSADWNINQQFFLLKRFDESGNLMWAKSFPINLKEGVSAVMQTPDGGFISVGTHSLSFNHKETYIIKTDSAGNIFTNGFSVIANNVSPCDGDSVELSTQNASDYLWSNGQTTQSIVVAQNGSYNVRVRDLGGELYYSDFYNVVFNRKPQIDLGNDTLICFNQNLVLDAGAGYASYAWCDGSTGQTLMVSGSSPAVLNCTVTVVDTLGCLNIDSIRIVIDICDGIIETKNENLISFESDPAGDYFSILIKNPGSEKIAVFIYNSIGEIVLEKYITEEEDLNISDLQNGIYFILSKSEKQMKTKKIIKLR